MMYTITATLNMNQNSPMMAALIGGTRNGRPTAMHRIAAPIRVFCCTGSFSFLSSTKQLAPEPINSSAGNTTLIGNSIHPTFGNGRSEEHTSELQSQSNLVCRLLLEKKKNPITMTHAPLPTP